MSESLAVGDVISIDICQQECRYEVTATRPIDLEPLNSASFPRHWDPLSFLKRHAAIQNSSELCRFKADLKRELVQAHFASVQKNGSALSRSQAEILKDAEEVDCLVLNFNQIHFGLRLDKKRIGELLAASVKWTENTDLAPLLLIDFPMYAQNRSDQMRIRLAWSAQGKEVLKEIGIDPTSLELCPPSADCNQQIIDIKASVETNVEKCIAASIEMSARRLSLLKALEGMFGGVVSHDRRGAVYGFVCTAGLTPVVVKLSFTRGQLTTWCKPDISLFYPDLAVREEIPYIAPAVESCRLSSSYQFANEDCYSLLSPSLQHAAQRFVEWDVDEPRELAEHIYARVVCKILSDFPKPARRTQS